MSEIQNPETENYDVVVVGGGPTGSTSGALLAKAGHRVLILERERFPRYHIGESLVTGMTPLMEELGLVEELDARYQRKSGISLRWGKDPQPWRSDFSAAGSTYDHAWHVTRSDFDELMLDNARKLGAEVREEAHVTEVLRDADGTVTGVVYTHAGRTRQVDSRFVVDASGQNRTVARKLTETQWQEDLRNVAIWGYYDNYTPLEDPNDILVEAIEGGGWMWGIPLSKTELSLGYVLSVEKLSEATRQGLSQREVFAQGLEASIMARTMVDAEASVELRTARDWSHLSDRFFGPGWAAVGDAAAFIDPLFSSGVWLGTSGAWLAARAIDVALTDPANEVHALERFEAVYRQLFSDILSYVRFFMDPNRLREEYMQRAQEITHVYTKSSRVGFMALISGIGAVADLVNFDPMGMEGLQEIMLERQKIAAERAAAAVGAGV
ncbi:MULTISPECIES: NAD(P)/FAD-dependent oxidoreductase [unclassified Kitasatospora]|uniref:NAD(P)/FAD-dependent oxidoreductase n=1 Tax=unclassified Kitasatospora TaxID=2633591 RepID=UPI001ADF5F69|nr:FAD-dependent oxidoreductase [Kitasatospora sp. RG8]MBP0452196.1 tryptophan 7-halogenase [Kitasatospora sp. RG8]